MYAYLHGFASGPTSSKGRWLAERFAETGRKLELPDLTPGPDGFENATPLTMLDEVTRLLATRPNEKHLLIGSSLGGLLAALYAERHPDKVDRLVLLAPAFRLAERWRQRMDPAELKQFQEQGSMVVDHYATGTRRSMPYRFLEDADTLPAYPNVTVPVLCIAGRRDELVPLGDVEVFVEKTETAQLVVVDDDHELKASLPLIWQKIVEFASF